MKGEEKEYLLECQRVEQVAIPQAKSTIQFKEIPMKEIPWSEKEKIQQKRKEVTSLANTKELIYITTNDFLFFIPFILCNHLFRRPGRMGKLLDEADEISSDTFS